MLAGIIAEGEPSRCAAEAFMVLRLQASVLINEMAVVSEVRTDILVSDLLMTNRTNITHNNTCVRYYVRME